MRVGVVVHSLVNAPVLGFDLVRRRHGDEVAAVLLSALSLQDTDLARLPALPGPSPAVPALAAAAAAEPTVRNALAGPADPRLTWSAVGARLRAATIGSSDALARMVRRDVLGWAAGRRPDVVDACCRAVLAAYLRADLPAADARSLAGPWSTLSRHVAARPGLLRAAPPGVHRLLDRVPALGSESLDALVRTQERARQGDAWVGAMHEATWAVHLTGRLRVAAAAQLRLVLGLRRCDPMGVASAAGAWSALSGVVQLLCVEDVLGGPAAEILRAPGAALAL